jgi:membrane-bound lytic murein transglycosylase
MKNLAILALLATLGGCAANANATDPAASDSTVSASHAAAEDQIAEAVFRYLFEHNASGMQKAAEKYCLSLPGEKMPDAAFLQRFEGNKPPVLAADQCDRKSGKNLFFRVQKFDWRKDGEVWVRGGYYEGNLSSSIELFQVVNENDKWIVKGARMEAIS